jgi:hypothetical protein
LESTKSSWWVDGERARSLVKTEMMEVGGVPLCTGSIDAMRFVSAFFYRSKKKYDIYIDRY